MNPSEETLQRKFESGENVSADNIDMKAYQQVFGALNKKPDYKLSAGFADKVLLKIVHREKEESSLDYFWFGFGVFILVMALVVTVGISLVYLGFKPDLGFLKSAADYKGLLIIALILVGIFNYVDSRFIRSTQ
jgi:hypothetical protein